MGEKITEGKVWEVRYYEAGLITPSTPTPNNVDKRVYVAAEDIAGAIDKFMDSTHAGNKFKYIYAVNHYQNGVIF